MEDPQCAESNEKSIFIFLVIVDFVQNFHVFYVNDYKILHKKKIFFISGQIYMKDAQNLFSDF